MHAGDMGRVLVDRGIGIGLADAVVAARETVWNRMKRAGGPASPGGSCLWHVVGWELSLKEWALTRSWSGKPIDQTMAAGILVATLGLFVKD